MSIPNHNIYENIRTRVIVLHRGSLLLNPPDKEGGGWRPPGSALEPDETLVECAVREVLEETGIQIRALSIAFLREWVVPKYCIVPDGDGQVRFGLEVFFYACPIGEPAAPRAEKPDHPAACWFRLEEIARLPVWPKEIKALASGLASGRIPYGVPSFVSKLESPLAMPSETLLFNFPAMASGLTAESDVCGE
jgi:8-oxo-dGTP pyrophosphatase MutT (NUDIX family)